MHTALVFSKGHWKTTKTLTVGAGADKRKPKFRPTACFQNYQGENRLTLWGREHIVLSHKRLKYDFTTQQLKKKPKQITKNKTPFEIRRKTFFLEKKCSVQAKEKQTKGSDKLASEGKN